MSWIDELNSRQDVGMDDRLSWNKYAQQELARKSPKRPKQNDKGFWTDQISTGGGIAGALGGAAAGAAAGSVVPVFGTAVGGLLGAILGGAAGSGGGEIAENFITDEEDKFKNVGSEALIGGATSVPITAGLKLLRAGTKATTGLGKKSAGDLVQEAGVQSIGRKQLGNMSANGTLDEGATAALGRLQNKPGAKKLNDNAGKIYAQSFTVPSRKAFSLKPEQTAQELMGYGVKGSLDNIESTSKNAMSELNRALNRAVEGVGGQVQVGDVTGVANNALKGVAVSGPQRAALMENLTDIGTRGVMPGYASPSEMLDTIRTLEKRGYSKINAGGSSMIPNPDMEDLGSAYVQAAKEIEDNLYGAISSTGSLKAVQTPETAQALNAIAKGLGDRFMQATDASEVRSLMAPFVRANNLVATTRDAAQSTMNQGLASGGLAGLVRGPAVRGMQEAVRAPMATTTAAGLNKLGGAGRSAVGQSVMGATARQAGGRLLTADAQPAQPTTFEESLAGLPTQGVDPAAQGMEAPQANPFGVSQEEVAQALVRAMAAGDEDATSQLQDLYEMVQEYEASQSETQKPLGVEAQKMQNNAQSGLSSLDDLESLIANDPSVVNRAALPDVAPLNTVLGTSQYRAAITNVQDAMTRLRSGASMNEQEAARFDRMLPRFGDSPEIVQYKLQQFRDYYNTVASQTPTSDPTTLEESLLMAQ